MGPKSKKKIKCYVVKRGHKPGIYMDWQEAELQIKGFSGATFCSFTNKEEAEKYMRKVDGHGHVKYKRAAEQVWQRKWRQSRSFYWKTEQPNCIRS